MSNNTVQPASSVAPSKESAAKKRTVHEMYAEMEEKAFALQKARIKREEIERVAKERERRLAKEKQDINDKKVFEAIITHCPVLGEPDECGYIPLDFCAGLKNKELHSLLSNDVLAHVTIKRAAELEGYSTKMTHLEYDGEKNTCPHCKDPEECEAVLGRYDLSIRKQKYRSACNIK